MSLGRKLPLAVLELELCGVGVSAAVVTMPANLLARTRATGYVVAPHMRPTVAIIVAIVIMQAT